MKKIILWSLLTFSLFCIVQNTGAVSYGGSSSFSVPDIKTSTGLVLYPVTTSATNNISVMPLLAWSGSVYDLIYYTFGSVVNDNTFFHSGRVWSIGYDKCTSQQQ
jgi:hypothetical protein